MSDSIKSVDTFFNAIMYVLLTYMGVQFVVGCMETFSFGKVQDIAFIYYLTWLIDEHNAIPYIDFMDTSFPGTFMVHSFLTWIFGYSDIGYGVANIAILVALMGISWGILKQIGMLPATICSLMVGLYFLRMGEMQFQRDYLAVLPMAASLLIAHHKNTQSAKYFFVIGLLMGVSASIKPHFIIGLPAVFIYAIIAGRREDNVYRRLNKIEALLVCMMGLLCWIAGCILWLAWHGSLNAFYVMLTEYLPLYMNLDVGHSRVDWHVNLLSFSYSMLVNGSETLFAGAFVIYAVFINERLNKINKLLSATLFLLLLTYLAYVILGLKGWGYQWAPFFYISILLSAFLLPASITKDNKIAAILGACIFFGWHITNLWSPLKVIEKARLVSNNYHAYPYHSPYVKDLAEYLRGHVSQDDKVALHITGTWGAFFPALMLSEIAVDGQISLQVVLYRNSDSAYARSSREAMLSDLMVTMPRYILDDNQFSFFNHADGRSDFPEYDRFIKASYKLVYDNTQKASFPDQFLVYERIDRAR